MQQRAGFTIVELVITITIMAILSTLAVVSLRSTQANARDEERKTDVANIALYLEGIYTNGTPTHPEYKGTYPVVSATSSSSNIDSWFVDFDKNNLRAPGTTGYSLVAATTNNTSIGSILPRPTITTYVYQPLDSNGALCTVQTDCRNFTLYYLLETDSTIQTVASKYQ